MAVTLELEHEDRAIIYRPVIFKVSSDRFDSTEGPLAVIGVTNDLGTAVFELAAPHGYQIGDTMTLKGFVGIPQYNSSPRTVIATPSATKVKTDLTFVGVDTSGTIERLNLNFNIKADVRIYDELIQTIVLVAADGPDAEFTVGIHEYAVGDFVKIFDTASYDGPRIITAINANNKFTIGGLAFVADEPGFARRGTIRAAKQQTAVREGGADRFIFNISAILKSSISLDLAALGQSLTVDLINPTPDEIVNYEVIFTEQFQGAFPPR